MGGGTNFTNEKEVSFIGNYCCSSLKVEKIEASKFSKFVKITHRDTISGTT